MEREQGENSKSVNDTIYIVLTCNQNVKKTQKTKKQRQLHKQEIVEKNQRLD